MRQQRHSRRRRRPLWLRKRLHPLASLELRAASCPSGRFGLVLRSRGTPPACPVRQRTGRFARPRVGRCRCCACRLYMAATAAARPTVYGCPRCALRAARTTRLVPAARQRQNQTEDGQFRVGASKIRHPDIGAADRISDAMRNHGNFSNKNKLVQHNTTERRVDANAELRATGRRRLVRSRRKERNQQARLRPGIIPSICCRRKRWRATAAVSARGCRGASK